MPTSADDREHARARRDRGGVELESRRLRCVCSLCLPSNCSGSGVEARSSQRGEHEDGADDGNGGSDGDDMPTIFLSGQTPSP